MKLQPKTTLIKNWDIYLNTKKFPKQYSQKNDLKKILKYPRPSEDLTVTEFVLLNALNTKGDWGKREEKYLRQIALESGLCLLTIKNLLVKLHNRGLVVRTKEQIKRTFAYKIKARISDKGIKILKEWENIY